MATKAVIYRDKTTPQRILVPFGASDDWEIQCVEIWNNPDRDGVHINARSTFIPSIILERHYRKEEL